MLNVAGSEMLLNAAPSSIECSQQPFAAQLTKCILLSSCALNGKRRDQSLIYRKPLRPQTFEKKCFGTKLRALKRSFSENFDDKKCFPKLHAMRRSFSENFDGSFSDDKDVLDDAKENGRGGSHSNEFYNTSSSIISLRASNSFLQSSIEILDPTALGIRPEAPNWPERESIRWIRLQDKAKSFALPNSLRMIQKKMQFRKGFKVLEESASCSVRKALSSMVFIMLELQSSSLKMREALGHEDLEMIMNKLQSDMQSSYAWLFQQVFSRTPALMICMILLLANFSLHSTSLNMAMAQAPVVVTETTTTTTTTPQYSSTDNSSILIPDDKAFLGKEDKPVPGWSWSKLSKSLTFTAESPEESQQLDNAILKGMAEEFLWNSVLDEVKKMKADQGDMVLDHEVLRRFVSPISVVLQADDYTDYSLTETRYKVALSQEPNNPMLLCNYAKFLLHVLQDPDRAEECFKRAVQLQPPDAESHCLYAEFLWKIRSDLWGAEQRYVEAVAAEPENNNHVSKYAEFLWSTGGEGTCFPID